MGKRLLRVGKIVNTHGIRGEVRVISVTDEPEKRFQPGNELILDHPDLEHPISLTVSSYRQHKQFHLLTFEGFDNINQVEAWKGGLLKVAVDEQEKRAEGEFYFYQIIGCRVVTTDGETLGEIKEILQTGANDVWVIKPKAGGKDILIPYIEECVREIDLQNKTVTVQLLEGLLP